MKKSLTRRLMAVVLTLLILVSTMTVSFTSVNAGLVTRVISGKWAEIALNTLERSIVYGISKASDTTENSTTSEVLAWTNRVIAGAQGMVNSQLLKQTKEISQKLDALYTLSEESFNRMEDKLSEIDAYNKETALVNSRASIRDFKEDTYEKIVNDFNAFYVAFNDYGSNPKDESKKAKLNSSYDTIMKYVENDNLGDKFETDLTDFLQLISPYSPNFDTTNTDMENNCDEWGSNGNFKTHSNYMYEFFITQTSFENNMYDYMYAGYNEVAAAAYTYIQAYRNYVEIKSLAISSNSALTSDDAKAQISALWNNFNLAYLKIQRGLNQMCSLYENEMNSYMRTYDTLAKIKIKDYKSSQTITQAYNEYDDKDVYFNFLGRHTNYNSQSGKTMKSDVIKEYQYVYQFRLANESGNTMYAIRNSNGSDSDNDSTKSNRRFKYSDAVEFEVFFSEESCFSLDVLNLLKNTYTPGNMNAIKTADDLKSITSASSYNKENTIITNLRKELGVTHNEVYLPDLNKGDKAYMLLHSRIEWDCNCDDFKLDDADMTWMNVSDLSNVDIDCEDDIYDNRNGSLSDKEVYSMFKGNPKMALKVQSNDSSCGDAYAVINNSNVTSGTMNCGDLMTLKVKPNSGKTVDSIVIRNQYGEVIDTLLADSVTDGSTIKAQELLSYRTTDENGYYDFIMPVPCQDATFEVNFTDEDKTLIPNTVTLKDGADGSMMQFTSYDYITEKNFYKGNVVSVSVMPEDGEICSAINVTDTNGKMLVLDVTDITNETKKIKPNERIYSFTMPECDVIVEPVISNGYVVNVNNDNSTHKFNGLNCLAVGGSDGTPWENAKSITFAPGDVVSMEVSADSGYYVSDVDIFTDSKEIPLVKLDGESGFCFIMPKENVNITISTEKDASSNYVANIKFVGPQFSDADFINDDFKKLNINGNYYKTGDTVRFVVINSMPKEVYITDKNGEKLDVAVEEFTDDALTENEVGYQFTMPKENDITINVECVVGDVATEIAFDKSTIDVPVESTAQINVLFTPETVENRAVYWNIADEKIATINSDGVITGLKEGSTRITAVSATNYLARAEVIVNVVSNKIQKIELDATELVVDYQKTAKLAATVYPDYAKDKNIKWESADETVATVDENGVVTGVDRGETTITVTSVADPSITACAKVKVNGPITIMTYEDLVDFANAVNSVNDEYANAYVVLGADIDCSGKSSPTIGSKENPFNGKFYGNNYEIKGLGWYLFDTIGENGLVEGVVISNADIEKQDYENVSALANNNYGKISKCVVKESELSLGANGWLAGLVVENMKSGVIENCCLINTRLVRVCSGMSILGGGGIAYQNNGAIKNCFTYGCSFENGSYDSICKTYMGLVDNCYGSAENMSDSGELTYRLNEGVTDGTQAWYQNLGEDEYPVLDNTHHTVFKVDNTYMNGVLRGDVNEDGTVTQADVDLLLNYFERKAVFTISQLRAGDVNGDGKTNPNDGLMMASYVLQNDKVDYGNTGTYGPNLTPTDIILVGDANFDGVIDTKDIDLVSEYIAAEQKITKDQLKAADVNLDLTVGIKDVSEIELYLTLDKNENNSNVGKYTYKSFEGNISISKPMEDEKVTTVAPGGSSNAVGKLISAIKNDSDPKGSVYEELKLKAKKTTKSSVTIKWSKIKKADKYIVYGSKCGSKYKKLKTATSKITSFTHNKLKKDTYYKYIVVAVNSKDKVITASKSVHIATSNKKVGNYKSIKVASANVILECGKKFKLKAKTIAESKNLKVKKHRGIKYVSTNTKIATVTSRGVIKAKKKAGTCYVYAYAQNGVSKKIKVVVKK